MKDLTGEPAYKAWEEILAINSSVKNINVFFYKLLPKFQDRSDTLPQDSLLFGKARELAISKDIPFHDAAITCALAEERVDMSFINTFTKANPIQPNRRLISRSDVATGVLKTLAQETQLPDVLSVTSEVRFLCGAILHLPMCDFRCPVTKKNEMQVTQIAYHLLPQGGVLINSGGSYHLLGTKTITHDELIRFFGSCLMFTPVMDRMYIAHHLIRGYGSLRISRNANSIHFPTIIRHF